jgi:hypothetical protein
MTRSVLSSRGSSAQPIPAKSRASSFVVSRFRLSLQTLKISNSLQEHQFSREQAETIAAAIAGVAGAELVTRKDLDWQEAHWN